jgi:hypothetical protein
MSDRVREIRNPKLVLIRPNRRLITQLRLAEIVDLEAQIACLQEQLARKQEVISVELRNGAEIEEGPHKAWFTKLTVH